VATIHPAGVQLLAVSTDSHQDSHKMVQIVKGMTGLNLTFPLLEDVGHKVIDRYGLLNMGTAAGPETRRFPTPATFILDKGGVVRWRFVEENWKLRPTNELIEAALNRVESGRDASELTFQSVAKTDRPSAITQQKASKPADTRHMVLIPSGTFTMGEKMRFGIDNPPHAVYLDAYYMDQYEVTNREYRRFLDYMNKTHDHSHCDPAEGPNKDHTPKYWNDPRYNQDDFPVVGVDWYDAYAYCSWAGKELPTEAQWEKAAWGGTRKIPPGLLNHKTREKFANVNAEGAETGALYEDEGKALPQHHHGPKPVGSYPPNGFGLYDMVGNAEEWVFDWYEQDYYSHSPHSDPRGPASGVLKVVRGASWHHGEGSPPRRYTHPPYTREMYLGFRCAAPAPARPTPERTTKGKRNRN
jgi:formylglycine-generating enzyme required for sulfatase activity